MIRWQKKYGGDNDCLIDLFSFKGATMHIEMDIVSKISFIARLLNGKVIRQSARETDTEKLSH